MVTLTVFLSREDWRRLRIAALDGDRSMLGVVTEALEAYAARPRKRVPVREGYARDRRTPWRIDRGLHERLKALSEASGAPLSRP